MNNVDLGMLKIAVATRLGVDPRRIPEIHHYPDKKRIVVLVDIFYLKNDQKFVENFTPPFEVGDKVIPVSIVHPRGGKKEDGLTDQRRRTVERVWLDLNTLSWWIWLKGKKFPFNPKFFLLASPRK